MIISPIFTTAILLSLIFLPIRTDQQKALLSASEIDRKFSQVWKESEASRKNYTWTSRTEVTRDEKVIQVLIEKITVDPDGRQIRKVISNKEAPLPTTFIIHKIATDQKAKIISFMTDLRAFLEKYALTDDSKRHSFFTAADISLPDAKGQLIVSGSDVFAKGDKLKWWIDTKSYTITYATILTTFRGVSADFSATYSSLPGLNYMAVAKIKVPDKNMVIDLKFYDFVKR